MGGESFWARMAEAQLHIYRHRAGEDRAHAVYSRLTDADKANYFKIMIQEAKQAWTQGSPEFRAAQIKRILDLPRLRRQTCLNGIQWAAEQETFDEN